MLMAIVGILLWWYTDGWRKTVYRVWSRLVGLFDYFSIDILLRTLFAPFRQISAGSVDGALPVKLRAFGDQLVSRMVGAVVRTIVMLIGIISMIVFSCAAAVYIVVWALVPVAPIVGLVMTIIGWIPWTLL